jgi:1,4-dihydroxy-2-naphthoate octaprenyltransferase
MIKALLGVARLNFLTLTLVCIALAASISFYSFGAINGRILLLVLLMALAAHISVNAFNEYFDFKSGLDFLTDKTPFSGGSGSLVNQPDAAAAALVLACSSLLLVIVAGLYLTTQLGWQLLLIGIPGVVLIYAYTQYINRSPLLCLLAPGIGFGFLMTLGASWVLSGQLNSAMLLGAAIVCCLASNLLLLNQFPDVEADRQVGRRHYPIILGRPRSAVIFAIMLLLSYLLLLGGIVTALLPLHSALALLSLPVAIALGRGVQRIANQSNQLMPYLALNVGLIHVFILLLAISLFWAGSGRGVS